MRRAIHQPLIADRVVRRLTEIEIVCRHWFGGHYYRIHDEMGAKMCLRCHRLEDYYEEVA